MFRIVVGSWYVVGALRVGVAAADADASATTGILMPSLPSSPQAHHVVSIHCTSFVCLFSVVVPCEQQKTGILH